eukprot:TRINITY_DN26307_c0_g1_i1.p1 TRINITY_DN26307_c0_g1~~TRINITY_DN26307_c0_g1_i1.p1  ORF type:complete len:593 (-),score=56.58 TRINITY_DN26307_c0_g1_i1:88-1866(-)
MQESTNYSCAASSGSALSGCVLGRADGGRSEREDDVRELSSELPASLLRGVPSHRALQGYGKHWRSISAERNGFLLSVPSLEVDDFISHEWGTSRLDKLIALCFIYNSTAALIGSSFFAMALVLGRVLAIRRLEADGRADEARPGVRDFVAEQPCLIFCPVVYFVMLFHWQSIRAAFLGQLMRARLVFLDKLCIHQEDELLKQQGILGLAAFLKQSRRLVILWSPRYFSRLWCTYELATWVRLNKQAETVVFMPVSVSKFMVATTSSFELILLLSYTVRCIRKSVNDAPDWSDWGFPVFITGLFLSLSSGMTYALQRVRLQLGSLGEQLAHFSVLDANCFCCSCAHKDPNTGSSMPCDRRLVYRTLEDWHSTSTKNDTGGMDYCQAFDEGVRTLLRDLVLSIVSTANMQLKYKDFAHLGLPFLWQGVDSSLNKWTSSESASALPTLLDYATISLLVVPGSFMLLCRIMTMASPLEVCSRENHRQRRWLLAVFAWSPLLALMGVAMWLPGNVFRRKGVVWLQLCWSALLGGLVHFLWRSNQTVRREIPVGDSSLLAKTDEETAACRPPDVRVSAVECEPVAADDAIGSTIARL